VRVLAWVAGVCLALLVVSGAANDRLGKGTLREVATYPTRFVRLQDRWGLFIGPRTESGWFVIHGQTNSGADVDLMRAGAPLRWERPASVINAFPHQRWRKLITRFRHPHMKARLDQYLNWLCRSQPQGEPEAELRLLKFVYVSHRIGPRYDHGPEQRKQLGQAACR
jgi:hypothetical protein